MPRSPGITPPCTQRNSLLIRSGIFLFPQKLDDAPTLCCRSGPEAWRIGPLKHGTRQSVTLLLRHVSDKALEPDKMLWYSTAASCKLNTYKAGCSVWKLVLLYSGFKHLPPLSALIRQASISIQSRMLQFGNLFAHFHLPHKASESTQKPSLKQLPSLPDFLQHALKLSGLRKEDVHCNLRVPDQHQAAKDDINMVILTGHGIFCIDVMPWSGTVCVHNQNWHVQVKDKDENFTNTHIEQVEDPIKGVTRKMAKLCSHLKRSGVSVRNSLFFPRVIFLSPDLKLDEELMKRRELVPYSKIDEQMESVRGILRKMGTWDLVLLHGGEQLKGDYQGCQYIALDRQDTETLEFSRVKTLAVQSLWALLGHVPQVTVKMYKRGPHGWLGKTVNATAIIPSNTFVIFRRRTVQSHEETKRNCAVLGLNFTAEMLSSGPWKL
ncbi:hypothetical protein CCH79_00003205 [Gambusia affinis]|uniref:NERD domain-containing protein n=1 Tax=Gambusia affinis TaxID=33528 RepID=A0A315VDI5_GAMAF|nr:hypothetical protein CCH79_00003205 [Gambusia affinis]